MLRGHSRTLGWQRAGRRLLLGCFAALLAWQLAVLGTYAHAAQPRVIWDDVGAAEVSAPPFAFSLELSDFTSPREITYRQDVDLEFSAEVPFAACSATVRATPTLNGTVIGEPAYVDAAGFGDTVVLRFPVASAGTYALAIEASVETSEGPCSFGVVSTPFATTIELFKMEQGLPGPASREKVAIASSGPHTLVARTGSRSATIPIRFTITDQQKRRDLLHSICLQDTSDCWIEDEPLSGSSWARRTPTGWTRDWGFWWERTSPSDCLSYYWSQPDVSVIIVISNRDGKRVGIKRHAVKLTCRS